MLRGKVQRGIWDAPLLGRQTKTCKNYKKLVPNSGKNRIREIEDNAAVDEDVSEKKARHHRLLAKIEEGLLDDIRTVKKELRREFGLG